MKLCFLGFSEDTGARVLRFDSVADEGKTSYTVRADLKLIRTYGIRVQELPLLCQALLERADKTEQKRSVVFTEDEMRQHASNLAAARAAGKQKFKTARRPFQPKPGNGNGWSTNQRSAADSVPQAPVDQTFRSAHAGMPGRVLTK
ncbi:MAG: hypothetical protein ACJ746_05510 [Bryobacteraceae bacterium]